MENLINDPRLLPVNDLKENESMNSVVFQEHFPVAPLSLNTTEVEFQVPANSNGLIDLNGSYIVSRGHFVDTSNANAALTISSPPSGTESVSLKEFIGSTLWKDVKIFLNGVEVNDIHPNLHAHSAFYKRMLQDLGGNGHSLPYKKCRFNNVPNTDPTAEVNATDNAGWKTAEWNNLDQGVAGINYTTDVADVLYDSSQLSPVRQAAIINQGQFSAASAGIPILTKLQDGVFTQPYFLPPNVDIRILLTKADDTLTAYCNDATKTPKFNITNSTLYVKRGYPTPSAMELFNRTLATAPLAYNLCFSKITQRSLPAASSIQETNLLNGVVPDRVLVAFVPSSAINGNYKQSPFKSSGANGVATNNAITSIYLNANGRQYPQRQYELGNSDVRGRTFGAGAMRAYTDYFNSWAEMNDVFPQDTPPVSWEAWCSNYQFFVFDLREDGLNENGLTTDLNNRGSIEVVATQDNQSSILASTMLVMGIYNAKMYIDANRNVSKVGF